ncbi:HepT-like ribonuclease domain-containing protein [Neomoorella glycerini]
MKMAQFRNIIVHDYARLDAEIIWGILKRDLGDLKHFMLTIKKLLGIS